MERTTLAQTLTGGGCEKFRESLEGTKRNSTRIKIGKPFLVIFVIGDTTIGFSASAGGETGGGFGTPNEDAIIAFLI